MQGKEGEEVLEDRRVAEEEERWRYECCGGTRDDAEVCSFLIREEEAPSIILLFVEREGDEWEREESGEVPVSVRRMSVEEEEAATSVESAVTVPGADTMSSRDSELED